MQAIVIPKDVRDTLLPPLYGTKHLHIQIESHMKHPDVVGIVDSLLRFSPQVDTLSFCGNVELEMLKVIHLSFNSTNIIVCTKRLVACTFCSFCMIVLALRFLS